MKTKVLLFNTTADELVDIQNSLYQSNYEVMGICSSLSQVSQAALSGTVDLLMVVTDKRFDQLFS